MQSSHRIAQMVILFYSNHLRPASCTGHVKGGRLELEVTVARQNLSGRPASPLSTSRTYAKLIAGSMHDNSLLLHESLVLETFPSPYTVTCITKDALPANCRAHDVVASVILDKLLGFDITKTMVVPKTAMLGQPGSEAQQHAQSQQQQQPPLQQSPNEDCQTPPETSVPGRVESDRQEHDSTLRQQQPLQRLQQQHEAAQCITRQPQETWAKQASAPTDVVDLAYAPEHAAASAPSALQASLMQHSQLPPSSATNQMNKLALPMGDRPGSDVPGAVTGITSHHPGTATMPWAAAASDRTVSAVSCTDAPQKTLASATAVTPEQWQGQGHWPQQGQRQGQGQCHAQGVHDLPAQPTPKHQWLPGYYPLQHSLQQQYPRPSEQPMSNSRSEQSAAAGSERFGLSTSSERLYAADASQQQQPGVLDAHGSQASIRKLGLMLSSTALAHLLIHKC